MNMLKGQWDEFLTIKGSAFVNGVSALLFLAVSFSFFSWGLKADTVLILRDTVSSANGTGMDSEEALAAINRGLTVEVVDAAGWNAKSQAQFATYRALILGDPACGTLSAIAAAEQNRAVWSPIVNGNVILVGTDPVEHSQGGITGARKLTDKAIAFAVDQVGKTGLYVCLSCYYQDFGQNTAVAVLDQFGSFKVSGTGSTTCASTFGHIVTTYPILTGGATGLTDSDLSNWSCSVHEFFNTWPGTFEVFALAKGCLTCGMCGGPPYILLGGCSGFSYPGGALDATFDPGTGADLSVRTVALQADRKVLIGGDFSAVNGNDSSYRIARLFSNGSYDSSFAPPGGAGANGSVYTLAVQSDGKVLLGGAFTAIGQFPQTVRNRIGRLNSDGTADTTFNPPGGADNIVRSIALQSDGKVIIGGDFITVNGASRNRIARLNSNGTLDTTFDVGTGADLSVRTVVLQADGKVLIGGDFSAVNGNDSSYRIARLFSNGSYDSSFAPPGGAGANGSVHTIAVQPDGKVLIGGAFTAVGQSPQTIRNRIARLNSDGTADTTFNPPGGADNIVRSIALDSDGKVLIGGEFIAVNNVSRNRIARLYSTGLLDTTFSPGTGANSIIQVLALEDSDCKVLIGGDFTTYDGIVRNRIARLNRE